MKKLLLLGALLCTACLAAQARNRYFTHLTLDDGLSHNHIKAIVQDSYGFIWIGTKNGLNRYDGSSIRIFQCFDPATGHGDSNISSLYEDTERRLWCGTDRGIYIYTPLTERFEEFTHTTEEGTAITNWVAAIESDPSGAVWAVVPNQGLFCWRNGQLRTYPVPGPQCLCIRRNGQVWVGTYADGLYRYNAAEDRFDGFHTDRDGRTLRGEYVFALCEHGSSLAIAVHDGQLTRLDLKTMTLSVIDAPEVHGTMLRDVESYDDELWVTTHEGVFVIDDRTGRTTHFREEMLNPYSLSDKSCSVLCRDREGGIWVGTLLGGVNYCANLNFVFDKYIPYDREHAVLCKKIRSLTEGPDGRIWIGTEDEGVCVFDPATGEFRTVDYTFTRRQRLLNTLGTMADGDQLWIGFFKHGIGRLDMRTGKLTHYDAASLGIGESSIYSFCKDSQGNLWIGSGQGVYVRRFGKARFEQIDFLSTFWAFDITEDSRGNLWFASLGGGLCRYEPASGERRFFAHEEGNPASLSSNAVSNVCEDRHGTLWFSTDRGGLCRYDYDTDAFRSYSLGEGMPDNVTYRVLEDSEGMLWLGTNYGLVRFNPETEKIRTYTRHNGLLGNQFNYHAALRGRDGKFWFGGFDGIVGFDPAQHHFSPKPEPALYITGLSINNEEQSVGGEGSPLDRSPLFTDRITLAHNQSNISLRFAGTSFSQTGSIDYYYALEPVDTEWIAADRSRPISFAQLQPGNYTFRIRAVNRNGGWQSAERSLKIVIRPPWWGTGLAKIAYLLIVAGGAAAGFRYYLRRKRKQILEQQRLFEAEKEKELYGAKIDFFTEIAHEVRTPLTLIKGPLEDIMEMNADPKLEKNLHVIHKNTQRLLELIRQLLDFRNVDSNKMRLDFVRFDIPMQLQCIVERFEPTIEKRGLHLTLRPGEGSFQAAADREALTKIVSNLLNNALKYAEHEIEVALEHNSETFSVRVTSDGEKIPIHLSEKIFEPFFRIDRTGQAPGAGIGLPMARSLAQLHKGHLFLDTAAPGNSFVLTLPLVQEQYINLQEQAETLAELPGEETEMLLADPQEPTETASSEQDYSVLLVEDNAAIQQYLAGRLRRECVVLTASNGAEALEILHNQAVDLVVSDIMMPGMDGMELCRTMKREENLHSIPLVFLTAKNDMTAKIEGLHIGAEAFIEKPFSFSYLRALIFSIMDNRRKEREAFIKRPFVPVHNIRMSKADEEFINRIIALIEEHMTNEQLNVEWLSEALHINRSSLLRKVKNITNLSVVDFIRLIRLKKAARMLQDGKHKINEVCYAVGITSPSYFSRLFYKQFGMRPRDFEKMHKPEEPQTDGGDAPKHA